MQEQIKPDTCQQRPRARQGIKIKRSLYMSVPVCVCERERERQREREREGERDGEMSATASTLKEELLKIRSATANALKRAEDAIFAL